MQYDWNKILSPEETVEKEFSLSPLFLKAILSGSVLLAIPTAFVSFLAGVGIFLLGFFYWFYLTRAKHYAFTRKRLVLVDSFLGTNITSVDYSQITDITIEQSVIDEFGQWGTLVVNTAGTHAPEFRLAFVADPQGLKQFLDGIRDNNPDVIPQTNV